MQDLFKKHNIKWLSSKNNGKAQIAERFNRTLKDRMYKYFSAKNTRRWVDVIDDLVENYNSSYHSSIKMTPNQSLVSEGQVRNNLYGDMLQSSKTVKPKFAVGDRVRFSKYKSKFNRGFTPNFTKEIFTITEILNTTQITYRIKDSENEPIIRSFYREELSIVK